MVTVAGRMDGETADNFDLAVEPLLNQPGSRLLINLKELNFINSRGLSSLIHIAQEMKKNRGRFAVCHLNGMVKEIFEAADLGRLITVFENDDEALKSLSD